MSRPAYSSLTAFLAHRETLRGLSARSPEQTELLRWMDTIIGRLGDAERTALEEPPGNSGARLRRERAERALLRLLRAEGAISS